MNSNPNAPPDAENIRERLFKEMRLYRGKRGIYAVEMLETARLMLDQPGQYPRQAEAAAYCIRQAIKEIFGDTRDCKEPVPDMVMRIAEIKDRIQTTDEDGFQDLYGAVDDLKECMCSPKPEARLKEIFKKRSGIDPEYGDKSLIQEYHIIKKKSNKLLHHVSEKQVATCKVRNSYDKALDVLTMIFLPSERLARIERLAELSAPKKSDLDELRQIMNNAYGFRYFASKMRSPAWFDLMEPDMLKSPSGNPPWLLRYLTYHLKDAHVNKFINMINNNFHQWTKDVVGLEELGFVGCRLGDRGLPLLIRTLQVSRNARFSPDMEIKYAGAGLSDHESDSAKHKNNSIRQLDRYALHAFLKSKQPGREFVELAEHLLKPDSQIECYSQTTEIPDKLVKGMDRESAICITKILVRELSSRPESERGPWIPSLDSIDEPNYDRAFGINGLVASMCDALAKARDLGVPTPDLISVLERLPETAKHRFEAWLYSHASDVAASNIIHYVEESFNSRHPNDEDKLLFEKLKRDGRINDIDISVTGLLGRAPDIKNMRGHPRQWKIGKVECWRMLWAYTIRPWACLPDQWKPCLDIVDMLEKASECDTGVQSSGHQNGTILLNGSTVDDPLEMATKIAAKSPDAYGFLELMGRRFPVQYLENTVRYNASKWAENPINIIEALGHPEYVAFYFRGLAYAIKDLDSYANRIIPAVKFAMIHQWDSDASDNGGLVRVSVTGIDLIKTIVSNNTNLGNESLSDAWSAVGYAVACQDSDTDGQHEGLLYLRLIAYNRADIFTI